MFTIVGEDIVRRESVGRLSPVDQVEATLDDLELWVGGDDVVEYVVDSGKWIVICEPSDLKAT